MKLVVNGKVVKPTLFFPNAANWGADWKTLRVPVPLAAGANTIRIGTVEPGGMYIDEISVK